MAGSDNPCRFAAADCPRRRQSTRRRPRQGWAARLNKGSSSCSGSAGAQADVPGNQGLNPIPYSQYEAVVSVCALFIDALWHRMASPGPAFSVASQAASKAPIRGGRSSLAAFAMQPHGNPAKHMNVYPHLVACEHCDSVYQRCALAAGEVARCRRCEAVLQRANPGM